MTQIHFQFPDTEARDAFLDEHFPERQKLTDLEDETSSAYGLPAGDRLIVENLHVSWYAPAPMPHPAAT